MLIWTCVSVGMPRACPLAFAVFRITLGKPKVAFHVSQSNSEALKSPRVRGLGRKIICHFWLWVAGPLLLTAATRSGWSRYPRLEHLWGESSGNGVCSLDPRVSHERTEVFVSVVLRKVGAKPIKSSWLPWSHLPRKQKSKQMLPLTCSVEGRYLPCALLLNI